MAGAITSLPWQHGTNMNLYCISRQGVWEYDEYDGFIVAAETEASARAFCNAMPGDEGRIWEDDTKTTCEYIGTAHENVKSGIVLGSFNAG